MSATISSMGGMKPNVGKEPGAQPATKPLWAAIGVLGVSVLAMGAGLIHISKRPAELVALSSTASGARTSVPGNAAGLQSPGGVTGGDGGNSMITETKDGRPIPSTAKVYDQTVKPAPKKVVKPVEQRVAAAPATTSANAPVISSGVPAVAMGTPPPAVQSAPAPVVAQAPARPVCANCGTIEAVTPVTRPGKGASGVGTVAGGVLGGVLGHQVGNGSGKDLATVLGAVGGAVAGNAVEKNIKKETVYSVRVHMQDGSTRTIEQATAPAVGAKVRVEGSTLRVDG
jgi:outer membrane lipoprotein SlyB